MSEAQACKEEQVEQVERRNQELEQYLRQLDFESMPAEDMLRWAAETFPGRVAINTSFQYTGMAQIHMAAAAGLDLRVATLDTLRLHPETYEFIGQVEARYGIEVEVQKPDPAELERMVGRFGEFLFYDSKERQEYCCAVRKTRPNERLLKGLDCWIAGLRRDQSLSRRDAVRKADLVPESEGARRKVIKLNPLADWSEAELLDFVKAQEVLTHPLYAQGYPSFGCTACATPIRPGEDKRAGRWRWFNNNEKINDTNKECGLHVPMYNI
jgi:phosphoadenosine phosphosulfate reductase